MHLGIYSGNMLLYTHSMCVFVCANMYLCMFACVQECIYVYMYACIGTNACMYVCMYVVMHVHVCRYASMCDSGTGARGCRQKDTGVRHQPQAGASCR
jgi:hypothetical protein